MHIIRPAAGRMCLNTMSGGIFNTNKSSPLSVSRLTRMFVPKPKKAFQSPGTQSLGLSGDSEGLGAFIAGTPIVVRLIRRDGASGERGEDLRRAAHPAEDAALG